MRIPLVDEENPPVGTVEVHERRLIAIRLVLAQKGSVLVVPMHLHGGVLIVHAEGDPQNPLRRKRPAGGRFALKSISAWRSSFANGVAFSTLAQSPKLPGKPLAAQPKPAEI